MKHTGSDVTRAARQWRHYNVEAARVRRYLPATSWMSLHYHEFCADPQGVFERISDFLDIDRRTMQQGFGNVDSHIIGNSRRLKGFGEIREDLSWQTSLGAAELDRIARIVGPTSHKLGFAGREAGISSQTPPVHWSLNVSPIAVVDCHSPRLLGGGPSGGIRAPPWSRKIIFVNELSCAVAKRRRYPRGMDRARLMTDISQ